MKTYTSILIACCLAPLFMACEKDLPLYNTSDCWLNFVYYNYAGNIMKGESVTDAMRQSTYSFIKTGASEGQDIQRDTVWFEVSTMGFLSDKDRPVQLKQIITNDNDAQPGIDYIAFDDPEFYNICKVGANQSHVYIPIVVLNNEGLRNGNVRLTFAFDENEFFKPGYDGLTERTLYISGKLEQPSLWRTSYWGMYGEIKHQLMIEWTGEAWDDEYLEDLYNGDAGYIDYLRQWFKNKLEEENAKRIEQGLDVYRENDENHTIISF